jgi:chromosome partitioning protein
MKIIAIAAQKGGVGKTTLTAALAVEASAKYNVAVMDADPQGSLSRWWNLRKAATPHFISCGLHEMQRQFNGLERGGMDFVFIDTPPASSALVAQVMQIADLIIVPTLPTQDDLDSIAPTLAMIRQDQRHIIVLNSVDNRTMLSRQARSALTDLSNYAPTYISNAQIHPQARSEGKTAQELNAESKAACEITALWKYASEQLK